MSTSYRSACLPFFKQMTLRAVERNGFSLLKIAVFKVISGRVVSSKYYNGIHGIYVSIVGLPLVLNNSTTPVVLTYSAVSKNFMTHFFSPSR
jgi:hypothetical protein